MKFVKTLFLSLVMLLCAGRYADALNADFSWMRDNGFDQKSVFATHNANLNNIAVAVYGKYVHMNGKEYRYDANLELTKRLKFVNLSGSYGYTDDVLKYHEYVLGAGMNVTKWLSLNAGYKQNLDQNLGKVNHKIFVPWAVFNYSDKKLSLFWKTSMNCQNRTIHKENFDHVGIASLSVAKHIYVSYNYEKIRQSEIQRLAVGLKL